MILLLVAYGVVVGTILFTLNQLAAVSGGSGILDFEPSYSKARVMEVLGSYGAEGMTLNTRIQGLDLFNPALYSLIGARHIFV